MSVFYQIYVLKNKHMQKLLFRSVLFAMASLIIVRLIEVVLFLSTHYGYGTNGINTVQQEFVYLLFNQNWYIFNLLQQWIMIFVIIFIFSILYSNTEKK